MKEVGRKITVIAENEPYINLSREKKSYSVTKAEENLFDAIKNVLRKDGIAVTTAVAYYICTVDFQTTYIRSWDKSKYNKLISTEYILNLVKERPDVFKLQSMKK